jgi:hypothetical protein
LLQMAIVRHVNLSCQFVERNFSAGTPRLNLLREDYKPFPAKIGSEITQVSAATVRSARYARSDQQRHQSRKNSHRCMTE